MIINKDEFAAWRSSDVTKAFFASVVEKREDVKEVLVSKAGEDPTNDAVLRGYCIALQDILSTTLDDVSGED